MHEAALQADKDPDQLSFVHAVRVVQRRLPRYVAIPPRHRKPFMKWSSRKFCKSGSVPAATGLIPAA